MAPGTERVRGAYRVVKTLYWASMLHPSRAYDWAKHNNIRADPVKDTNPREINEEWCSGETGIHNQRKKKIPGRVLNFHFGIGVQPEGQQMGA